MTLSIAARCPDTGQHGVGAITHMIGIGKIVTHAGPGIGAIATQGEMNPYHGIDGLARMEQGPGARDALEPLVEADAGREERQSAAVDARGGSWAWTGADLPEWKGHRCGEGCLRRGELLRHPLDLLDRLVDLRERVGAHINGDITEGGDHLAEAGEHHGHSRDGYG
jgi:uncharacterized Ntn-hydrolase superfamily protein